MHKKCATQCLVHCNHLNVSYCSNRTLFVIHSGHSRSQEALWKVEMRTGGGTWRRGGHPHWKIPGKSGGFMGFPLGARVKKAFQVWLHPKQRLEGTIYIGHSRDSSGHIAIREIPSSLNKRDKIVYDLHFTGEKMEGQGSELDGATECGGDSRTFGASVHPNPLGPMEK